MSEELSLIVKIGADQTGLTSAVAAARSALDAFGGEAKAALGTVAAAGVQAQENVTRAAKAAVDERVNYEARALRRLREIRREAILAERRQEDAASGARFGRNDPGANGGNAAADKLLTRANAAIAIQAVSAGLTVANALMKSFRGEAAGAYEALERLPLGLGQVASGLREVGMEWLGINAEIEKYKKETEEQEARQRRSESRIAQGLTLDGLRRQKAIMDAGSGIFTDYAAKQAALIADATAENERKRMQERSAGGDARDVEEAFRIRQELDKKRIERQIMDEKHAADAVASHKATLAGQQIEADRKAMQAVLEEEAEQRKKLALRQMQDENDKRREAMDSLREQLGEMATPSGDDFITSASTALGNFSVGQAGAGAAVANAAKRQVELQTQIKDIAAEIKEGVKNIRALEGWK